MTLNKDSFWGIPILGSAAFSENTDGLYVRVNGLSYDSDFGMPLICLEIRSYFFLNMLTSKIFFFLKN